MTKNKNIVSDKESLLSELLENDERLSGVERFLRILGDRCGRVFLTFKISKYPIIFSNPQWRILIIKNDINIYDNSNMSLFELLKESIEFMDKYIIEHKNYDAVWKGEDDIQYEKCI